MNLGLRTLVVAVFAMGSISVDGGCSSTATSPRGSDIDASDATDGHAEVSCPLKPASCDSWAFQTAEDALACFASCKTDADCLDPCEPFCSIQGLILGGDYNCNGTIRVCRRVRADDCP